MYKTNIAKRNYGFWNFCQAFLKKSPEKPDRFEQRKMIL